MGHYLIFNTGLQNEYDYKTLLVVTKLQQSVVGTSWWKVELYNEMDQNTQCNVFVQIFHDNHELELMMMTV